MKPEPVSRDTLLSGRLVLTQPARGHGYRFNLDPVLLAGFVGPAERVIDLGAGVGVIGLLLLAKHKAASVVAVERQAALAALARDNGTANGLGSRFTVHEADLRTVQLDPADLVVFNPPYFAGHTGRRAKDVGRDEGRHERHGTLADFVAAAVRLRAPGGRIAAIVPTARVAELQTLLSEAALGAQRRREVRPRQGEPVNHWLVEAQEGRAVTLEAPLVVHQGTAREFTPEVAAYLAG